MQSARVMKTRFRSGSATIRHLVESRTPPTVFQPLVRGNLLRARVGSASSRQLSAALGITKREYELTVLKSESGANKKEEVEKEVLDPATVPRRVLSALLDTVAISAVAANVAEYAIKTHATGTEPFICTFAALWILRDQADFGLSRFSVGKRFGWVRLVHADRSQFAPECFMKEAENFTCAHTDKPATRAMRLLRNAHWLAVFPLAFVVPDYYLLPALVLGMPLVELTLIFTVRRSIGDFIAGTHAVYHDSMKVEQRKREDEEALRKRKEVALRRKVKRLAEAKEAQALTIEASTRPTPLPPLD